MFGFYRYLLAFDVMFFHFKAHIPWPGSSVFIFYFLSGFLMTKVLGEKYGYGIQPFRRFMSRRIAKVYLPYIVVFLPVVIGITLRLSRYPFQLCEPLRVPISLKEWLENFFLIPLDTSRWRRIVPPSWSLGNELVFYILLAFGIGRTRLRALIWLVVSAVLAFLIVDIYTTPLSASLGFSLGSVSFHFRHHPWIRSISRFPKFAILSWVVFALSWSHYLKPGPSLYVGLLLGGWTVLCLSKHPVEMQSTKLRRLDSLLGDFSYLIYLTHWPAGILVINLTKGVGPLYYFLTLLLTHMTALLIYPLSLYADRIQDRKG